MIAKLARLVLAIGGLAAVIFASAGRLDLGWCWAYVGVVAAVFLPSIRIDDPALRQERLRPGPGGVDGGLRALSPPLVLGHLVVAGLDVGRFHWSDSLPAWCQAIGLVALAAGLALALWSMAVNTFFSPLVRLQTERGHRVISEGPYGWVRHPGYLGMIVAFGGSGAALGSLWSMAPALAFMALVVRRAALEDRFLHEHLVGYAAYAARVRHRLIPGVW